MGVLVSFVIAAHQVKFLQLLHFMVGQEILALVPGQSPSFAHQLQARMVLINWGPSACNIELLTNGAYLVKWSHAKLSES